MSSHCVLGKRDSARSGWPRNKWLCIFSTKNTCHFKILFKALYIFVYVLAWGGAPTHSARCACGTRGVCEGGDHLACNCDAKKGDFSHDFGRLVDKSVLPVSEICMGIANDTTRRRVVEYSLGSLVCTEKHFGETR